MNSKERAVWEARWKSVETSIDELAKTAGTGTIGTVVASLRAFAKNQFDFFIKGFAGEGKAKFLETSPQFPAEYALNEILRQTAVDLTVLQLAISQRSNARMAATLAKADQLVYKALKPAIEGDMLDNTAVITYFQKNPSIRLIPYAPVAIIGLPVTSISAETEPDISRDLLAIPHEVGHYVFKHGTINGERIKIALRDRLTACEKWLYRWKEEIFSDVYGTAVAGPVMALDFQDLMIATKTTEYLEDDTEHPIPALRPRVYNMALRATAQGHAVNALAKRWNKVVDARVNIDEFTTAYGKEITLKHAKKQMKSYIHAITDLDAWPTDAFEVQRWSKKRAIDKLYPEFNDFVDACTDSVPEAVLAKDGKTAQVNAYKDSSWNFKANEWTVGHFAQRATSWNDNIRHDGVAGKYDADHRIPPEVWTQILMVNHWITGVGNENAYPD